MDEPITLTEEQASAMKYGDIPAGTQFASGSPMPEYDGPKEAGVVTSTPVRDTLTEQNQQLQTELQKSAPQPTTQSAESKLLETFSKESSANDVADPFYDNALSELSRMQSGADSSLASQISSIAASFEARKAQMRDINKRSLSSLSDKGIRGGGSRYAGEINQGILSAEERAGVSRLTEIDAAEQAAIAQAQGAKDEKDWRVFSEKMNLLKEKRQEKQTVIQQLQKSVLEQQQKAQEQETQFQKDSAIAGIVESGVTDPISIMRQLRSSGLGITFNDVANITDKVNQAEKFFPGIVGELQAAIKAGFVPEGTSLADYAYMKDPMAAMDMEYKQAEIDKIKSELNENGIDADPVQVSAYANEYAATGKIPTGVPKGMFGIIAQAAKEAPKNTGVIVDRNTGVKSSATNDTLQGAYGNLYSVIELANELKELDKKRWGGVIAGTAGKVFGSQDQARYMDLRGQMVDLLARARSGAALTPSEEERYSEMLPGRFSESFGLGTDSEVKIDNFIKNITSDLSNKLDTQGLAIYGFTKIKIGNREYTVGDVVTNADGSAGRILPDGSISLLDTGQDFKPVGNTSASKGGKEIVAGYDITSYATDPAHGKKVQAIYSKIPQVNTAQDIDKYIQRIAPGSPVKGTFVINAAKQYGVDPKMLLAIMQQDSTLGTKGLAVKTFNPGNVGNTDNGSTKNYGDWNKGVLAVAKNLSWRKKS